MISWKQILIALSHVIEDKLKYPIYINSLDGKRQIGYHQALDDIQQIIQDTFYGFDKQDRPDAIDLTQWYDEHKN